MHGLVLKKPNNAREMTHYDIFFAAVYDPYTRDQDQDPGP